MKHHSSPDFNEKYHILQLHIYTKVLGVLEYTYN